MKKSTSQISHRYATTLLDLAIEGSVVADVSSQAQAMLRFLDEETMQVFLSPAYEEFAKLEILKVLLDGIAAHDVLQRVMRLVLANRRFPVVREILANVVERADVHLGVCRAEVVSARPVDGETLAEFEKTLSESLSKQVFVVTKTDEALKAGFVVKIGNTHIDASLSECLARWKESLVQGV